MFMACVLVGFMFMACVCGRGSHVYGVCIGWGSRLWRVYVGEVHMFMAFVCGWGSHVYGMCIGFMFMACVLGVHMFMACVLGVSRVNGVCMWAGVHVYGM